MMTAAWLEKRLLVNLLLSRVRGQAVNTLMLMLADAVS